MGVCAGMSGGVQKCVVISESEPRNPTHCLASGN